MSSVSSPRPHPLPVELLDTLPAEHPDARHSRRDLRVFNAALGNARWFAQILPRQLRAGERVLEVGAGEGDLGLTMHRRGIRWDGIDLAPRPPAWPRDAAWHRGNVFHFDEWPQYPVIAGNLILHHFTDHQLGELGARASEHARLLVLGDLRRGRIQQWLFAAFARAVGANRVSRHDGWLSIAAGFRGHELPRLLGLDPRHWAWQVPRTHFFAYRLVAFRKA